jgi:low affinity Fe/Cu permease
MNVRSFFSNIAAATSVAVGSWQAFMAAFLLVAAWIVGGFFIGFDNGLYQLIINTVTTIITFLVVFLIQAAQNRDTLAIHAKLDEIIRAIPSARNGMRQIETLPVDELKALRRKPSKSICRRTLKCHMRSSAHPVDMPLLPSGK